MEKERLKALLQGTPNKKYATERMSIYYYEQSVNIANEFAKMEYILAKEPENNGWLKEYYVNLCNEMDTVILALIKFENFRFKSNAKIDERFDAPRKCIVEMNQEKENVESLFLTQMRNNSPEL